MNPICAHAPWLIAALKISGPSLAILAAAAAWLANRFLSWVVWAITRHIDRAEVMTAIQAEISNNLDGERFYSVAEDGKAFLEGLKAHLPAGAQLVPYVAVEEVDVVFDGVKEALRTLPRDVIGPVVRYYDASKGLAHQLADFRSDAFYALERERQEAVFLDTYRIGAKVVRLGERAAQKLRNKLRRYRAGWVLSTIATAVILLASAQFAWRSLPLALNAANAAAEWEATCDLTPAKTLTP